MSLLCNGVNPNRVSPVKMKHSCRSEDARQALQPSKSPPLHAQTTMTHNNQPTATSATPVNPLQVTGESEENTVWRRKHIITQLQKGLSIFFKVFKEKKSPHAKMWDTKSKLPPPPMPPPVVLRLPAERRSVSSTAGLEEQGHTGKPKLPAAPVPTFYPDLQAAPRRIGHSSRRAQNWCVRDGPPLI